MKTIIDHYNTDEYAELYVEEQTPHFFSVVERISNNSSVLDIGCASGGGIKLLLKKTNQIVGVDNADKLIKKAKEKYPQAKYFLMDAVEFSEKYKNYMRFDYIIAVSQVFSYITKDKKRKQLINNLFSMLKKNGKMFISFDMSNKHFKDLIRVFLSPILSLKYGDYEKFGDGYVRVKDSVYIEHFFNKKRAYDLFNSIKGDYEINFINPYWEIIKKSDEKNTKKNI